MPAAASEPSRPASRFSLLFTILRGGLAGLVASWAVELVYIFVGSNVHVVAPGAVYRSAQLGPAELERVVRQYHIRTVVNLCGCCDPESWYLQESRTTCRLGICQEDVGFSACRLPSIHSMRQLVEALDHCDYPILIHCHRGIDRTGMASAIALLLHTDAGLSEAREQLGLRYGHMAAGKYGNIDRFFDLYQEWLNGRAHTPALFREWVAREYCPGECRAAIDLLAPRQGALTAVAGRPSGFRVRCTNTSVKPWVMQPGANAGVHLGWMLSPENVEDIREGRSGLFDAVVQPGQSVELTVALPPLQRGRYRIQLDMVDEQHAWFYQTGATEPLTLSLEVP
ncbi:MAG TPA: tyrosine-protein phosphatase [Gemmataceae bacterium]|nr:tyrosine-protein phosphatase [Gemmataceae bacterium]